MAYPLRMGNTNPLEPPPSGRTASRMSSARRCTGTRCSRFAFIRAAPRGSGGAAGPGQLAVGERDCSRARATAEFWTRVDRKMLWSPAASSDRQRARVLASVKARRSAPPPLRRAQGLDPGSAHARPDWLLPTMPNPVVVDELSRMTPFRATVDSETSATAPSPSSRRRPRMTSRCIQLRVPAGWTNRYNPFGIVSYSGSTRTTRSRLRFESSGSLPPARPLRETDIDEPSPADPLSVDTPTRSPATASGSGSTHEPTLLPRPGAVPTLDRRASTAGASP